jgi:hypothetical protein
MTTAKRILTPLLVLGVVTFLSQAVMLAQTNATTSTAQPTTAPPDETKEFHKGEFNLSPFATYVDQTGGKWGAGAAATYFITDKIGLGAATYWTETGGTFFDNVAFEGYFRLPLKRIAPYGVVGLGYQFDRDYWFETIGAGLDFRAFKRFDAFSDVQWRIANSGSAGDGVLLRLGVRFNL